MYAAMIAYFVLCAQERLKVLLEQYAAFVNRVLDV